MNLVPRMDPAALADGYRRILRSIYAPRAYYRRVTAFLRGHRPPGRHRAPLEVAQVLALLRAMFHLGIAGEGRLPFWRLFLWSLLRRPGQFSTAMTLAIYGFHFRRVFELQVPGTGGRPRGPSGPDPGRPRSQPARARPERLRRIEAAPADPVPRRVPRG
jgi:hypothetical protein